MLIEPLKEDLALFKIDIRFELFTSKSLFSHECHISNKISQWSFQSCWFEFDKIAFDICFNNRFVFGASCVEDQSSEIGLGPFQDLCTTKTIRKMCACRKSVDKSGQ